MGRPVYEKEMSEKPIFSYKPGLDGDHVAILDVNSDYEAFDDEVGSFVSFYKVDCSNRDQCFENVEKIGKKFGKINHLVYSVAYFGSKTYQATEEDWSKSLMINTAGAGFMISAVVPFMEKAEKERRSICLM